MDCVPELGPLKIAIVSDWFFPRFGGLELHLHELAQRLAGYGHDVHVITGFPGADEVDGVRVHRLQVPVFPKHGFVVAPSALTRLRSILQAERFDLVHCHFSYVSPTAFLGAYVAQRSGIPTVMTFHSFIGKFRLVLRLLDMIMGWTRWPVQWTAVSRAIVREVAPVFGHDRIEVLPNGITTASWQGRCETRERSCVVLASVMRLKVRKRPRALIRIIHEVRRRVPAGVSFKLKVIGDGPERSAVQGLIRRWSLEDTVELMGVRGRDEIRQVYAASDLFVLPTILESFGIAALEAHLSGLPVVGRRETGLAEFVRDGLDGSLVPSDRAMVDCLVELILDESRRSEMAENIRVKSMPDFGWDATLARHTAAYRQAIELAEKNAAA